MEFDKPSSHENQSSFPEFTENDLSHLKFELERIDSNLFNGSNKEIGRAHV